MKMLRHPMIPTPHAAPDLFGTLEALIAQLSAPPSARTARLVRASTAKKARKLVEEATEVALDAVSDNHDGVIAESVDLLYHLAVLWHDRGIEPADIRAEMTRRAAVLGLAEKRPKKGAARRALEALEAAQANSRARGRDRIREQSQALKRQKASATHRACALYRKDETIGHVRMSDMHLL